MLPAKRQASAPATKSAFTRALERFTARQEAQRRVTRLGFIIDATASREESWEQAQAIQARMFRAAGRLSALQVRLMHFGGDEITDHGWLGSPRAVAAKMAGVRCRRGCTQVLPALRAFAAEEKQSRASAVILIGDFFEESIEDARDLGLTLKNAGIKIFSFLEGNDQTAATVFRRLAEATGGSFARFGADLPLGALCEGVALLTAGGTEALTRLSDRRVRQLLLPGPGKK